MVQDVGWVYLSQGELGEMFKWIFNTYFPFLIFWVLLGIAIFSVVYVKTKNIPLSTVIISLYFIVVSNFMIDGGEGTAYNTIIKYISLLLIVFIFFLLYRAYKGSG